MDHLVWLVSFLAPLADGHNPDIAIEKATAVCQLVAPVAMDTVELSVGVEVVSGHGNSNHQNRLNYSIYNPDHHRLE